MFGVYMDNWKDLKNHFVFVIDLTYEAYSDLCKVLNGRYSPEDSTSSSSKSKEMINKYWIWNHFKWDYLSHVTSDDKMTLEEVSMKEDRMTFWENLGFEDGKCHGEVESIKK